MNRALVVLAAVLLPAAALAAPKKKAPAPKNDLKALLLSSAWCSFSYNQVSGATKTKRVAFRKDGTWSAGARRETYSSGRQGTYAGQSDATDGGRWDVREGRLLMSSSEDPQLTDIGLVVSANSNGYPILTAGDVEYSQCR